MSNGESIVIRVKNRVFSSNTYICQTRTKGHCILVDPGLDVSSIEAILEESGLIPQAIFCTHGHFDHIGSADHFRVKYSVAVHLHSADLKVARSSNFLMMAFKVPGKVVVPEEFVAIDEEFIWSSGGDELRVVHVPGHTPGGCIVRYRGNAFTGDSLYRDGVGLVSLPGENVPQLVASLRKIWDLLPDDTTIYPGHGGSDSFGRVKRNNAPLRRMMGLEEAAQS